MHIAKNRITNLESPITNRVSRAQKDEMQKMENTKEKRHLGSPNRESRNKKNYLFATHKKKEAKHPKITKLITSCLGLRLTPGIFGAVDARAPPRQTRR